MKKIVSYILLLVMCVSLFAGCAEQPAETQPATNVLEAAYNYVRSSYIDGTGDIVKDIEVTNIVTVGDVTMNVAWELNVASGDAAAVALEKGEKTSVMKVLNKRPAEDVVFSLVGTITHEGNSKAVTLEYRIVGTGLAGEEPDGTYTETIADGDRVLLYYPEEGLVMSADAVGNKMDTVVASLDGNSLIAKGCAVLNVTVDADGYYTFTCNGKYLTSGATGNSLTLADEASEYSLWILEAAEGGYYIKNANAAYSEKPQYMEFYSGFTTYSFNDTKANIYTFQFYKASENAGKIKVQAEKVDAVANSDKVVLYYPEEALVMSATAAGNKMGTEVASLDGNKMVALGAAVLDVTVDADGYYTFTCNGKYLTSGATGNSLTLADEASEYSRWELTANEGGNYYIRNVGANYNGKYNQYLEFYSGFTTYGFNESKANIYTFQFYKVIEG